MHVASDRAATPGAYVVTESGLTAGVLVPGLRGMIEQGNAAAACVLTGIQLAVALLNAGAMAG